MRALFAHPYTLLLARGVLGFVFLRSGLGKALDRKGTLQTVLNYEVLPQPIARAYGFVLPWVELTLAVVLLIGLWTRLAAFGLSLLLVSFGFAVSVNLLRGREMDCGCAGRGTVEKLSWRTLARILVLLMLAMGLGSLDNGYFSLSAYFAGSTPGTPSPPLTDFVPVVLTALAVVLSFRLLAEVTAMYHEHQLLRAELAEQTGWLESA